MNDSRKRSRCMGAAIIELALIVPLIIVIGFSAIEVSSILRHHELAQMITRETAMRAYRDCSSLRNTDGDIQNCLDTIQARMQSLANSVAAGSSVFVYVDEPNRPTLPITAVQSPVGFVSPSIDYYPSNDPAHGVLKDYLLDKTNSTLGQQKGGDTIVAAQIWLPYTPLVPFISRLLSVNSYIYDLTIV